MENEELSVRRFREYLRCNTAQPKPDYAASTAFLKKYAEELNLQYREIEFVPGKPVIIISLIGTDIKAGSIMLNSHTDVVPVSSGWSHDPFMATKVGGRIYGI